MKSLKDSFLILLLLLPVAISCTTANDEIEPDEQPSPRLLSMRLLSSQNSLNLIRDAECEIIGDSIVCCWIPYLVKDKFLSVDIKAEGGAFLDNQRYETNQLYDFSKPVELRVESSNEIKKYTVYIHTFTGLPVVWIETDGRQAITSKEDYVKAHFKLVEDVVTRSPGDVIDSDISIKGRGNHTWLVEAKKPYKIKFPKKTSLIDEPADKTWLLLANHYDKTMLRNKLVFFMGQMSNLEYTPRSHFVELMLNGRYDGTYQLTENLKIAENRSHGILLEVDRYATKEDDARYFTTEHLDFPVNIKDPDVEYGDDTFNTVKEFFLKAEKVLFSDNFKDKTEGWQKYIDIDTVVDWYIITELAKDAECIYMLCHMTWEPEGKLKMGPLWDYDMSFGNYYSSYYEGCQLPTGFYLKNSNWFARLFEDENFVKSLKDRYSYFYEQKENILQEINHDAEYLKYSVQENNNRWDVFYHPDPDYPRDYDIWGCYENEVQNLKCWLSMRMDWMKDAIADLSI